MSPSKKWDKENVKEESRKYNSRGEFIKGSHGAYKAAKKLGIYEEVCSHMKPKFVQLWDVESIRKEALKYQFKGKFMRGSYGAYKAAKKFGIIDEVCAHMKSRFWTKEKLLERAGKYKSLKEFREKEKGAYIHALRNNLLEAATDHMERLQLPHGYWNKERCLEEARKYSSRTDFMRKSGSAYNSCLRNNWVDEVCSHMGSPADGYKHCVYAIFNKRQNLAYIGVTRQLFKQRIKDHKDEKNSTKSKEITNQKDTEYDQLTDYLYDAVEVKDVESEWVEKYSEKGFKILNDLKQLGRTGSNQRIYTDEIILKEAKKYKTRVEFKTKSPRIYGAACSQQMLDIACSHMRGIKEKNYWTKEKCIEFAKTCKDRSEFVRAKNGAYDSSKDNKWLDEIYSFLRSRNDMSWLRPATRKDVWSKADEYYELWVSNERCGYAKLKKLTGLNLNKLQKKFSKGWDPSKDKDWKKWSEEIKKSL